MSSIAGYFSPECRQEARLASLEQIADQMLKSLSHRGPDGAYRMSSPDGILMGNLLITDESGSTIVPTQGKGALSHLYITMEDGIYNYDQLCSQLEGQNISTKNLSHPEILLYLYHLYGERFATILQGGFAIAIADTRLHKVVLFRDPLGVKPLFYHHEKERFLFASEIKGLLACPGVKATMDIQGMHQVFSLGPAHVPGTTMYQDIYEVRPGRCITYTRQGLSESTFWHLQATRHEENYEETIKHAGYLLTDAIHRQFHSEASPCCLLSGGLDSSLITALAENESKEKLKTFSFDFTDSSTYFSANSFQPSLDRPYVIQMAGHFHTDHTFLECSAKTQASYLSQAVIAQDGPCMADIASSLIYFCSQVAKHSKVAFTGECADELFCGYPWYHRKEMQDANTFPWAMDLSPRKMLLKDSFLDKLQMDAYVKNVYENCCNQVSYLPEDTAANRNHRRLFVLTTQFFMQTLVDRMDRAAAITGIQAICPFCDTRLAEYLYNVPWEMKAKDGEVKHVLREIAKPLLPDSITQRKKSPYPKNYNPQYEQILCQEMLHILQHPGHPIRDFLDPEKTIQFCHAAKDYGKPWYGQLMAGPQLLAYYLQTDFWLRHYHVDYTL